MQGARWWGLPAFEHILQTEGETVKFRLLAVLAVVVLVLVRQQSVPVWPATILVVAYLVYTLLLNRLLLPNRRLQTMPTVAMMLTLDTAVVLAALAVVGLNSPVFILVPLLVIYYSMHLGYLGSLATATLCALGYGMLVRGDPSGNLRDIASIQIPLLFLVALLTGYLASQRFREREERMTLQRLVETETRARDMLDMTSTLLKMLDPVSIGRDIARLGALTAGSRYCLLLQVEAQSESLVLLAANLTPQEMGLSQEEPLEEPLSGDTPGARILREGLPHLLWHAGDLAPLPTWLSGMKPQGLLAIGIGAEKERPQGVIYFMSDDAASLEPRIAELQRFTTVAGALMERIQVVPQVERRGTRLLGQLRHTVESLERFRDLRQRTPLRVGPLNIDPAHERAAMGDQLLSLGRAEFDALYLLAQNEGSVVSHDTILREVWGKDFVPKGNPVDVCIHRLRRKLGRTTYGAGVLKTVRGQGYMLQLPRH